MGVNKTRRFVAESLSFTHRYVPVGLLERLPTNMNERAFPYKGRDELEVRAPPSLTADAIRGQPPKSGRVLIPPPLSPLGAQTLLASDQAKDWLKICEMFLGPAPDDWNFVPKVRLSFRLAFGPRLRSCRADPAPLLPSALHSTRLLRPRPRRKVEVRVCRERGERGVLCDCDLFTLVALPRLSPNKLALSR